MGSGVDPRVKPEDDEAGKSALFSLRRLRPFSRTPAEQFLQELAGVAARFGGDGFRRAHGDELAAAYAEIGRSS
jgi:hypothetical protein